MQKFMTKTSIVTEMIDLMERRILKKIEKEYSDFIDEDLMSTLEKTYLETNLPFIFIIDEWDCVLRYYNSESDFFGR